MSEIQDITQIILEANKQCLNCAIEADLIHTFLSAITIESPASSNESEGVMPECDAVVASGKTMSSMVGMGGMEGGVGSSLDEAARDGR